MAVILIIDDDKSIRDACAQMIASLCTDVVTVAQHDPLEALAWLDDHTPDVILLDFRISGLMVEDYFRIVRSKPRLASIPIVV